MIESTKKDEPAPNDIPLDPRPSGETGCYEVGDAIECALRVEITSDTQEKVETFRQQLCDVILAAPATLQADVMVTIYDGKGLPVFETNRSPVT